MVTLIELFVAHGALDPQRRQAAAESLLRELFDMNPSAPGLAERARALATVVVHDAWLGPPDGHVEPPRYLLRLSVPAGHLTDAVRAETIARLTRALAHHDPAPDGLFDQARAWVHIVETPDGNIGAFGRVVQLADIVAQTLDPTSWPTAAEGPGDGAAPTTVDSVCGMTVTPTEAATTFQHDGVTYGFCGPTCRDLFAVSHTADT